ncbi:MAG TPA: ABC transporter ATP-binding protein [Acidothermaceae bacterium]|jgi:peptide/nickel transport system ATP-binding protein|nr:ABC transporter ATP-binding protein [Acidothermaceae bacterium]
MSADNVRQAAPALATNTHDGPLLEAVDVTKHYRVRVGRFGRSIVHAAENISVALYPGTVTAVVGESGSGKSTLSRMLARTQKLTSGKLYFQGEEVSLSKRVPSDYRRSVQLVLQDPFESLNPVHTVRYILSRPLIINGRAGNNLEETILKLLRRVALEPAEQFIGKYPHELSGGQRQRVSIARGLAVEPKVLLADEPVSMLDVSIRLGVLNLLADLRDRERLAILYVTHDIASARYLADTIMVMYAGKVVEVGPADSITNSPAHPYTKLLLSAAPDPDADRKAWLGAAGAPPSLVQPPSGCRFHPRCPYAMPICSTEAPPAFRVDEKHTAACWLHEPAQLNSALPGHTASLIEGPPVSGENT